MNDIIHNNHDINNTMEHTMIYKTQYGIHKWQLFGWKFLCQRLFQTGHLVENGAGMVWQ